MLLIVSITVLLTGGRHPRTRLQPEAVSALEAAVTKHGGVWKRVLAEFNSTQPQRSIGALQAKWAAVIQGKASCTWSAWQAQSGSAAFGVSFDELSRFFSRFRFVFDRQSGHVSPAKRKRVQGTRKGTTKRLRDMNAHAGRRIPWTVRAFG